MRLRIWFAAGGRVSTRRTAEGHRAQSRQADFVISTLLASPWSTWGIAGLVAAGVIARPFSWPEFIWAAGGAAFLVLLGLLSLGEAWAGVAKGGDVYLFLTGMMLLSELARQEGLFDWLAARAAGMADGSAARLFAPGVRRRHGRDRVPVERRHRGRADARGCRRAGRQGQEPLPYLFVCAFIANAASFVLPISNPANLVIYGSHMPPLLQWLPPFALPSVAVDRSRPTSSCAGPSARRCDSTSPRTSRCRRCPGGQDGGRRDRGDGGGAAGRVGARYPARAADLPAGAATALLVLIARAHRRGGDARYFLGRAAAGRRAVRAGGGAGKTGVTKHLAELLRDCRPWRRSRAGRPGWCSASGATW